MEVVKDVAAVEAVADVVVGIHLPGFATTVEERGISLGTAGQTEGVHI